MSLANKSHTNERETEMAFTKIKNARLLLDAVKGLEYYENQYPLNELMIAYYKKQVQELTKRVYG
jgi:hypothetical protein